MNRSCTLKFHHPKSVLSVWLLIRDRSTTVIHHIEFEFVLLLLLLLVYVFFRYHSFPFVRIHLFVFQAANRNQTHLSTFSCDYNCAAFISVCGTRCSFRIHTVWHTHCTETVVVIVFMWWFQRIYFLLRWEILITTGKMRQRATNIFQCIF